MVFRYEHAEQFDNGRETRLDITTAAGYTLSLKRGGGGIQQQLECGVEEMASLPWGHIAAHIVLSGTIGAFIASKCWLGVRQARSSNLSVGAYSRRELGELWTKILTTGKNVCCSMFAGRRLGSHPRRDVEKDEELQHPIHQQDHDYEPMSILSPFKKAGGGENKASTSKLGVSGGPKTEKDNFKVGVVVNGGNDGSTHLTPPSSSNNNLPAGDEYVLSDRQPGDKNPPPPPPVQSFNVVDEITGASGGGDSVGSNTTTIKALVH